MVNGGEAKRRQSESQALEEEEEGEVKMTGAIVAEAEDDGRKQSQW